MILKSSPPRSASPCTVLDAMRIGPGCLGDWAELAGFHYRPGPVVAVTRIWVAQYDPALHPADRGPAPSRPGDGAPQLAAVLVEALPPLSCRLRDLATQHRFRIRDRALGAARLNREFRTISRVVVHPLFRGLGLAVRLVRHALEHADTPHVEALAAMGRIHPFFRLAGMRQYDRPADPCSVRVRAASRNYAQISPLDLCTLAGWRQKFTSATPQTRSLIIRELERFARIPHHPGHQPALPRLLAAARRRLLSQPLYYLWQHPGNSAIPIAS